MYNCELFSVRKSKKDFIELEESFDAVSATLYEQKINIAYLTDINADAGKIASCLQNSLNEDEPPEYFIFANTLNTADATAFKNLFYEFISRKEAELAEAYPGKKPKIKVHSIGDLGNGYRGYCFRIFDKKFIALPYCSLVQTPIDKLIVEAVGKTEDLFVRNADVYPHGIVVPGEHRHHTAAHAQEDDAKDPASKDKKKKKEGFFSSFIPHKTDPKGTKIRKWIILFAIVAFIGAMVYVVNYFIIGPMHNTSVNSEIQEIAYRQNTDETTEDGKPLPEQDWKALKKMNKEIVGWVRIDGTKIDYPVFEHKGDDQYSQYYLKHNYKHEYSDYGSIFVDYRSTDSVNSKNVILHGHHMLDGSMFENLMGYGGLDGNLDYYKDHPVIVFNTPEGDAKWKIISVFKTSTLFAHGEFFNYMQGEFTSEAEFMNFVYNLRIRSLFNIPVVVNEDDQLLTLSTCSYEFNDWRTVVVARKVREGESEKVDTQLATINNNIVFPDVYYMRYGGTRPTVLTFKTANKKGLITWYDGKGDLKGDETLTATVAANPTEPPTEKPKKKNKATEAQDVTFYQITYIDFYGNEYQSFSVKEGDPAPYPDNNPGDIEDEYYVYKFRKWDTDGFDMDNITTGMTIAPVYEPIEK